MCVYAILREGANWSVRERVGQNKTGEKGRDKRRRNEGGGRTRTTRSRARYRFLILRAISLVITRAN